LPLHVLGLACGIFGGLLFGLGADGPWPPRTQELFVISFAFWQWTYLLPSVLLARRRHPGLAAGLAVSGCFGVVLGFGGLLHRLFSG
jgi:hypothetical protein